MNHQINDLYEYMKYDNLTAIDWIHEYTKERHRQGVLRANSSGFLGRLTQILDASKVWWVLIATGIASGVLAGSIDVVSDWLSDLKTGYCSSEYGGGKFYLNKSFCCWGYNGMLVCSYVESVANM